MPRSAIMTNRDGLSRILSFVVCSLTPINQICCPSSPFLKKQYAGQSTLQVHIIHHHHITARCQAHFAVHVHNTNNNTNNNTYYYFPYINGRIPDPRSCFVRWHRNIKSLRLKVDATRQSATFKSKSIQQSLFTREVLSPKSSNFTASVV